MKKSFTLMNLLVVITILTVLVAIIVFIIPALTPRRVFVTSTAHSGNLGGLVGADRICQSRADEAGLGGTWKAWLSSSTLAVEDRLIRHTVPIYRIDGVRVANNWVDLVDGQLINTISRDERNIEVAHVVWTGTNYNGKNTKLRELNCSDWTSNHREEFGQVGGSVSIYDSWTNNVSFSCFGPGRLYCFEQ